MARGGGPFVRYLLALLPVTVFGAGCGGADDVIRIGVAGNFSDPSAAPMRRGAELAAAHVNATGGIGGRRLELVIRDDRADADTAVAVANELYESDAVAVIGHVYSGPTLAAAAVYNAGADPILQLSPSASAPAVSNAGPYTFRLCPSDLAHGAALADWARRRLGLARGAVFYQNEEYGRGVRQTFVRSFDGLGGEVVAADPYLGDAPDVGPYLDRIVARRDAQFIVVAGYRDDAATILRAARARSLALPLLGGDGLEGIQRAGPEAEGVYTTSAYFSEIATETNRRFVEAYRRAYPGTGEPNQSAAGAYDAVFILKSLIERVGTGRQELRDALADIGTGTPPYQGLVGAVAFDSLGDVPSRQVYVGVVRNGAVQLAEGQ